MYITRTTTKSKNKSSQRTLLRQSFREGRKVKNRTIANLSHCSKEEIEAVEFALKNKKSLDKLIAVDDLKITRGMRLGAVWTGLEIARRLGIDKALGAEREGAWRYILRRNLWRAGEIAANRSKKQSSVERLVEKKNCKIFAK